MHKLTLPAFFAPCEEKQGLHGEQAASRHEHLFQGAIGIIPARVQGFGNDRTGCVVLKLAHRCFVRRIIAGEDIHVDALMNLLILGVVFFNARGVVLAQL